MEEVRVALIGVAAVMFTVAAFCALWRITRGPSGLDRSVATDLIIAVVIGVVAIHAMLTRQETGIPVLVVLSLLGFTAAVGMSRLTSDAGRQQSKARRRLDREEAGDDGA